MGNRMYEVTIKFDDNEIRIMTAINIMASDDRFNIVLENGSFVVPFERIKYIKYTRVNNIS